MSAVKQCWYWDGENEYGAEAPGEADRREIVAEWLWWADSVKLDDLTSDEVEGLLAAMRYQPLFSVVKADLDNVDADLGAFHSDGTGKRWMSAWFIPTVAIHAVVDAVCGRAPITPIPSIDGET